MSSPELILLNYISNKVFVSRLKYLQGAEKNRTVHIVRGECERMNERRRERGKKVRGEKMREAVEFGGTGWYLGIWTPILTPK